jgi:hypothetical protein
MFSQEILARIHADHAREQAEARKAALASDGIFIRIETGTEANQGGGLHPFREQFSRKTAAG